MKFLHDKFVIIPVDRASNKFGIVCKNFYLDVIKNELGISNDGSNKVYKAIYQETEDIHKVHERKLLCTFCHSCRSTANSSHPCIRTLVL